MSIAKRSAELGMTLTPTNDWGREVESGLKDALAVSMNVMGRSGEQACKHALILMARSARKLTPQSRKNRTIQKDEKGRYLEFYWPTGTGGTRKSITREWEYSPERSDKRPGSFIDARGIGNRGLAKRSWMWGLKRLGAASGSRGMTGVNKVYTITRCTVNGYVMDNRLSYISKIMPSGWQRTVAQRAGNTIMKQAQKRIEGQWKRKVNRNTRTVHRATSSFFGLK